MKAHRLAVRVGLAAGLALAASPAQAQRDDEQLWLQVNTNLPIAEGVRLTVEQIARFGDRPDGLYQTELGGILGFRVAPGVELGAGYRRVAFYNGNTNASEHRLRQHVVVTSGPVTLRLRVDERFHPAGDEVGFRVRPLVRYNQKLRSSRLVPFFSHESFVLPNSTRWGQRRGYERMRNIVGVAVPVARRFSLDAGYLNQYRPGRGGARDEMDHALTLQLTIDLAGEQRPHADD